MVKNPPANAGDTGLISGSGRFSGGGNGNPLQCSGLENPVDVGAWQASPRGRGESGTTEHLHFHFSLTVYLDMPSEH